MLWKEGNGALTGTLVWRENAQFRVYPGDPSDPDPTTRECLPTLAYGAPTGRGEAGLGEQALFRTRFYDACRGGDPSSTA